MLVYCESVSCKIKYINGATKGKIGAEVLQRSCTFWEALQILIEDRLLMRNVM